jgi:hypothetical protein
MQHQMVPPRPIARLIAKIFQIGRPAASTPAVLDELKVHTDLNPKHEQGTLQAIRAGYARDSRYPESVIPSRKQS